MILRRAIPQDASLLFALFAADKAAQFAATGLTEAQYRPLLDMQYKGRAMTYSAQHPNAEDWIVCIEEGSLANASHASMEKELAVGRCLLSRTSQGPRLEFRLVDLAILPPYRGRGIATQVLQQLVQQSAAAGAAFSLRVEKQNPALRLYERLGFFKVSGDELSYEMEWQPPTSGSQPRSVAAARPAGAQLPTPGPSIPLRDGTSLDRSQVLDTIFTFLREIGLTVHLGSVPVSFLPGIQLVRNGLRIDLDALLYPGDLLHEAGHLAVMTPDIRHSEVPVSTTDGGEEMAVIAWSYAAALHLGLLPEVVFHEHGYRGQSQSLIQRYAGDCPPGVPLLWWMGLTTQPTEGVPSIYPRMLRWLRPDPIGSDAPANSEATGNEIMYANTR